MTTTVIQFLNLWNPLFATSTFTILCLSRALKERILFFVHTVCHSRIGRCRLEPLWNNTSRFKIYGQTAERSQGWSSKTRRTVAVRAHHRGFRALWTHRQFVGCCCWRTLVTERFPAATKKRQVTRNVTRWKSKRDRTIGQANEFSRRRCSFARNERSRIAQRYFSLKLHTLWSRDSHSQTEVSHEQITVITNRALAYLEAISALQNAHISAYKEPKIIETPSEFFVAVPDSSFGCKRKRSGRSTGCFIKENVASGHIIGGWHC